MSRSSSRTRRTGTALRLRLSERFSMRECRGVPRFRVKKSGKKVEHDQHESLCELQKSRAAPRGRGISWIPTFRKLAGCVTCSFAHPKSWAVAKIGRERKKLPLKILNAHYHHAIPPFAFGKIFSLAHVNKCAQSYTSRGLKFEFSTLRSSSEFGRQILPPDWEN